MLAPSSRITTKKVLGACSKACSIQRGYGKKPILNSFGTTSSAFVRSFSSKNNSNSSNNNNNKEPNSFRPRRRLPKALIKFEAPTPKKSSKKATPPIKVTDSSGANESLEALYGQQTGSLIRHLRRTEENKGVLNDETAFLSAEDTMRAADYLTADTGSIEDLVGERRAMMDAWDEEQAKLFKKSMAEITEEQTEFSFNDLPWKEDANVKESYNAQSQNGPNEDAEDPHQKAFGPWSETVIRVDRVQKVQRGGTMVRYRALVVGGKRTNIFSTFVYLEAFFKLKGTVINIPFSIFHFVSR